MTGWVAIDRGIFSHEFFAREPFSEREAWLWMIANAAWQDTRHRVGGEMLDVPRGSFYCTLRGLQSVWMWGSDTRVRRFLKRTQTERMTRIKTNAKKTLVTICNYDEYQSCERKENAKKTQGALRSERKENALKEQVNNKQVTISMAQAPKKRASRLPEDWVLPGDYGEWAQEQGLSDAEIKLESERFKDYWIAASGKTASKLDWLATWRNWIRNSKKGVYNANGHSDNRGHARPSGAGGRGYHDSVMDGFGKAAIEIEGRAGRGGGGDFEGFDAGTGKSGGS